MGEGLGFSESAFGCSGPEVLKREGCLNSCETLMLLTVNLENAWRQILKLGMPYLLYMKFVGMRKSLFKQYKITKFSY